MSHFFSRLFFVQIFLIASISLQAQSVKLLNSGSKASLRGLSVVTDDVVWVSGSGGSVGRSVDGGESWIWKTVKGFEKIDFSFKYKLKGIPKRNRAHKGFLSLLSVCLK